VGDMVEKKHLLCELFQVTDRYISLHIAHRDMGETKHPLCELRCLADMPLRVRYCVFLFDVLQMCGRAELKFIVDMGLWGGLALGVIQMGFWLLWSPKWTLSAGASIYECRCFYI